MVKEILKENKRRIGDIINELSQKAVPFDLNIGDKTFNLFIHQPGQDVMDGYGEFVKEKKDDNSSFINYFACHCIKDGEGLDAEQVWETPEKVAEVKGFIKSEIQSAILRHIARINLSGFALKNSQGSPSSEAV